MEVSVPPARQNKILATPMAVITDVFKQYIKRPSEYLVKLLFKAVQSS
jgi:hypothetical protein